MTLPEVMKQAKLLSQQSGWDARTSIVLAVNFTPGSCSVSAHRLTNSGLDWALDSSLTHSPAHLTSHYYDKVQVLLSDRFMGFFMAPDTGLWNYNFVGLSVLDSLKYALVPACPKDFYAAAHRPNHFLKFTAQDDEQDDGRPEELPEDIADLFE
jgi:pre-mRNA-processing factor 8